MSQRFRLTPFVCVRCLQLVLGPSGVLQGIRPGKCYVEMSTVDPETITELSQVCTKEQRTHLLQAFVRVGVAFRQLKDVA